MYKLEGSELTNALKALTKKEFDRFLDYLSDEYYFNAPVITDEKYDFIESIFETRFGKREKIGAKPDKRKIVKLPIPMFGMDKAKEEDKLIAFANKFKNCNFVLTDKLDGVSAFVLRENDAYKIYKRGTATEGSDISYLAPYLSLPEDVPNGFAVRAELIIRKKTFEEKIDGYVNARALVAGLTNPNVNEISKLCRYIHCVCYHIYTNPPKSQSEELKILKDLKFEIPKYKVLDHFPSMLELQEMLNREDAKYDIDGICIAADLAIAYPLDRNPRHIIAYKQQGDTAIVTINKLTWSIGKTGRLIPVIEYDSVLVSKAELKKATAHNAKFILDNGIGVGAKVVITRSNEVIPKIIDVIEKVEVTLPPNSHWDENKTFLITNDHTEHQNEKIIEFFFSTLKAMNVGGASIQKLYDAGFDTIEKVLRITLPDVLEIDGFQKKSAERLIENIELSTKDVELYKLMTASYIFPNIGIKRMQPLLEKIEDDFKYDPYSSEISEGDIFDSVIQIPGIGESIASTFAYNLEKFNDFYRSIADLVTLKEIKRIKCNSENTQNVVFTGVRPSKELKECMMENGYNEQSSVNSKTNILVVKDTNKVTTKISKALELGIQVVSLEDFMNNF